MKNEGNALVGIIVILIILLIGGGYFWRSHRDDLRARKAIDEHIQQAESETPSGESVLYPNSQ